MRGSGRLCAGIVGLALAAPGATQAVVDGRTIYEAAFFAAFQPATARDIVDRVPGFRFEDSDTDVRGFAGAAGNVVIDGRRPSTKSATLDAVLRRIPAARIRRAEVAPGDLIGAEFAGRAQVLNLVTDGSIGLSGTVEASALRAFKGDIVPEGGLALLLNRGESSFNLAVEFSNDATLEVGWDRLFALPGGELLEFRDRRNSIRDPELSVAGGWRLERGANSGANLTFRLAHGRFRFAQDSGIFPARAPRRTDRLSQRENDRAWEVGGDASVPLAGGGLKLIALVRRDTEAGRELFLRGVDGPAPAGFAQDRDQRESESVVRLVWSGEPAAGWSLETGAEAALNRLDSDIRLFEVADRTRTPVPLPLGRATVREVRGEAFVNAGRALAPALRIDAGLTVETSRLTVSGDADARRALTFPKPRLSLDWQSDGWRLRASVERIVAQLDFGDFVSAAELANERLNGGNADLEPQRYWEALASAERTILGDGLVRLEAGYRRYSELQDRVPVGEGLDAPGNLPTGEASILRASLDAPLGRFGIAGGRLTALVNWFGSSVVDPYTGRARRFSGADSLFTELGFRQDLGSFAWGFTASTSDHETVYRRTEEDRLFRDNPRVNAFAEWRPDPRTTVRLDIQNATDAAFFRERRFFTPDRSAPAPVLLERRLRTRHVVPGLGIRRTFG